MDMLMHTDANIVAWEPAPKNLFVLTSTLMQLEEKYRKRVALFPIGAGDVDMASVIYAKVDNMGHSVVGKPVDDDPTTPNHFLVSTAHTYSHSHARALLRTRVTDSSSACSHRRRWRYDVSTTC